MAKTTVVKQGGGGFAYFLGFLGALVYYVTTSSGVLGILYGIFKALFWPAFLVYNLLKYIQA